MSRLSRSFTLIGALTGTLCLWAGCSSDEPKADSRADTKIEAEPPAEPAQPPAAAVDAGATDAGTQAAMSDAGSTSDAGSATTAEPSAIPQGPPGGQTNPTATVPTVASRATVFDRVLAKPKQAASDAAAADAFRAQVEKASGAKVEHMRRTARTWVLITFVPVNPPRDAKSQQALIDTLKSSGLFASVEGDRMMQVKTP